MVWYRLLLIPLLLTLTVGLGYSVLSMPEQAIGLQTVVADNMDVSGVSNPVTAVLLNFRAYDTLLEMVVLMLALLGVWSLGGATSQREARPGSVLDLMTRLLVPVLILVAGYLLWVGAQAPGGAFQAGSVLGAAGVLLLLTGWRLSPALAALPLRCALVAGTGVFLAIAVFTLLKEGKVLQYAPEQAGVLILIIEAAATLSIGVTLTALFLGHRPPNNEEIE